MKAHSQSSESRDYPDLTDAEWRIMKTLWKLGPSAAGTVQEALAEETGWAYSTVKTTMDRMTRKGILSVTKIRNLQLFEAKFSRTEASRREVQRLLKRAFDGAVTPMINHLVEHEDLSREDLDTLRKLIDEAAPEGEGDREHL